LIQQRRLQQRRLQQRRFQQQRLQQRSFSNGGFSNGGFSNNGFNNGGLNNVGSNNVAPTTSASATAVLTTACIAASGYKEAALTASPERHASLHAGEQFLHQHAVHVRVQFVFSFSLLFFFWCQSLLHNTICSILFFFSLFVLNQSFRLHFFVNLLYIRWKKDKNMLSLSFFSL
jgi:hypothetical protein